MKNQLYSHIYSRYQESSKFPFSVSRYSTRRDNQLSSCESVEDEFGFETFSQHQIHKYKKEN